MIRGLALLAALGCLALMGGCGEDDEGAAENPASTAETRPTATAPSATQPPPDATAPAATTPTPPGGAEHSGRETDEGGDEEPIRVPAQFTLRGGRLRPATVSVPAFLAVELTVRNRDPVSRVVVVRADRDYVLGIPARARRSRLIPGQRAGHYPVIVRGGGRAALLSGGEPGP